jgi:hypothetical protein
VRLAMLLVLITSVCAVVWVIVAAVRGLLHLLAGAAG